MRTMLTFTFLFSLLMTAAAARADDLTLVLRDHKFSPQNLIVPTGQKFKLIVKNEDATPSEFESAELDREKVVAANSSITVFLGPLDPGSYGYFDDFHRDTTTGVLTAK